MEVEMAVESNIDLRLGAVCRSSFYFEAFRSFIVGFRVEGDTLEWRGAVMAGEAFGVEAGAEGAAAIARARSGYNAAGDRERAG